MSHDEERGLWLPSRFGKSQLESVTPDTMRQQVEAQRDARERGLVSPARQARLDLQAHSTDRRDLP